MYQEELLARHRRRKKIRIGILLSLVILVIVSLILFFGVRITAVSVEGNVRLSDETVESIVFSTSMDRRYFYQRFFNHSSEKKYSMLSSVSFSFHGMGSVTLTVEENPVILEIPYVDSYLGVDQDGYILCGSKEPIEGIPVVNGISFDRLILYQEAQTDQTDQWKELLDAALVMREYGLEGDVLTLDEDDMLSLTIGTVTLAFGKTDYLAEKVEEYVRYQKSIVEGLSGTLHLETYPTDTYIFEKE